ncbi:MAG: tRNA (N(6)-L-threonylcarbamoyladenosine(37)-C(2))-methylthiotransferase MtaB [Ignavibacteria bacterium]|jgi:threonylcarbamoyladenosine tRNA methylthiotransferase MtaB|nr:tRNA (N(6)-L-threonylcarbamoyladenosine(37)-C(2))-methylthiotransferase MtaB [Ignavibacteria bacterium]
MNDNTSTNPKVRIINIGCKVNFADSSRLKQLLIEADFDITNSEPDADIILINTCAVTNHSEAESRQIVRRAKKNNPKAYIGVLGCYAQLHPEDILSTTGADVVYGINEKFKIPELLKQRHSQATLVTTIDNTRFEPSYSAVLEYRTRAFVKLQDGCNSRCTYCTVPNARGNSRCIEFSEITPLFNNLVKAKYKEIVVSGINLSDYKATTGECFHDLVKLLSKFDADVRFRISSIEPHTIDEQLISLIASSHNICPHFHIPLQSGSDEILQQMHRRYNTTQFRKSIELINEYLPNAFIGLDVIAGFPGETEANFRETKAFIEALNISEMHCFTYSKRDGTPAATMPNQIDKRIKKNRTNELIAISKQKHIEFLNNNINKTVRILTEKYNALANCSLGHSDNYISCIIKHTDVQNNEFRNATITKIANDTAVCELL